MPGLVPGIHVFARISTKDVDGRDKPGHDDGESNLVVIASAAKQSIARHSGWMDCFVAVAPRNNGRSGKAVVPGETVPVIRHELHHHSR